MGCGCRKGNRSTRPNKRMLSSIPTAKSASDLRNAADQKIVERQLSAQSTQSTQGGMDKDRREIERKRRLMILQKLHRL